MGTWLNIFIKHNGHLQVTQALQELSGVEETAKGAGKDVLACHDLILYDEKAMPTYLITENMGNGWIRVSTNSFAKLPDWIEKLSARFQTTVLQVIAQNTADYYYILVYENGRFRRELEGFADKPEEYIDRGELFSFETPFVPGTDEYGCEKTRLGEDSLYDFCNGMGFDFYLDLEDTDRDFYLLKRDVIGLTLNEYLDRKQQNQQQQAVKEPQAISKPRPWWKFW